MNTPVTRLKHFLCCPVVHWPGHPTYPLNWLNHANSSPSPEDRVLLGCGITSVRCGKSRTVARGMLYKLPLTIFAYLMALQSNEAAILYLLDLRETWSGGVINIPCPRGARAGFHTKCEISLDAKKPQYSQLKEFWAFPEWKQSMLFYANHIFMITFDNNDQIFFTIQKKCKCLPRLESYLSVDIKLRSELRLGSS